MAGVPLDPEDIDLPTLAALAGAATTEYLLARVRKAGHPAVRASHGWVFQHLVEGTPTVTELAQRLGVTQQAASKWVAELEAQGYVERRADEDDSRIRRIALTPKGRSVIERGRDARAKLEAELRVAIGPRALATARKAMIALLSQTGGLADVERRRAKPPRT